MKKFLDDSGNGFPKWKKVRLGDIANIATGFTPKTDDKTLWNGDFPWLSIKGMDQGKYISKPNKTITEKALGKKKIIPAGTLLMTFKLTLGKLAILKEDMFTNEAICNFQWKNSEIDTEFMYYALSTIDVASFGSRAVMGITLNSDSLDSIIVPLPSLEEQKKIAEFFKLLDQRIEKQAEKVDALKEYKRGIQQKIFTRELVFTDGNGNAYPEWEEKKLGEVAKIKKGFTPSTENRDFWNGDIHWLSITGFKGKYISEGTKFISKSALGQKSLFPAGSLVMSFKLTLGKLGILTQPMMTNEAICMFDWVTGEVNNDYAFYALDRLKFEKFANQAAAGLTLNDESLNMLPLSIPSLPEQKKIAEVLSAFDKNIELNENNLALLKEQKKGYLQRMFS